MLDERVAAPERGRRRTDLFALIDSVLDDPTSGDLPATQVAQSAAETLGLPWRYMASIGQLHVCLDASRPARYVRWLPWPRRPFTMRGTRFITVTDHYGTYRFADGSRMKPLEHTYEMR